MSESIGLVIVAAGSSSRMGGIDKVWAPLGRQTVLEWSLVRLARTCRQTVVVVRPDEELRARTELSTSHPDVRIVHGGPERQDSVFHGIEALDSVDFIAVHDAARPLASSQMLRNGMTLLDSADGAVPVEPVKDTIKRVDSAGAVVGTIDRDMLRAAQTPQLFRATSLRRAHADGRATGRRETDDAALLEAAGMLVVTFPGHWTNFKITCPDDLTLAELLAEHNEPLQP